MLDKITGMKVFVTAVKEGSFAAAAAKLAISPQMIARHVATLETGLGVRLLNRTTRKQSLTTTGIDYYKRCLHILGAIEDAERIAMDNALQPSGTLRVNAPVAFGRYALIPFVTDFLQRYREIRIELTLSDVLTDPLEQGFDAVIRIGALSNDLRLVARPLPPYRLVVCAAPSYLEKNGTPESPVDLARHECLEFSPWHAGLTRHWTFIREQEMTDVDVNGRFAVNDWGAMLEAALHGAGILIGYEKAVRENISRGELLPVMPGYHFIERPMHVLYGEERFTDTKVRCFIDDLGKWFHRAL
ncbi:LysR family transcriptional regulator [Sodalis sp. dw_96]|uniref:LysR family transcriptional regulator n=1 Tax=Sodalis sp. dw_96 TaxID=2719794 RepID=UPI001BD69E8C|nr:LysR family transcriptional regulator [Sodalis sp. dw_96]